MQYMLTVLRLVGVSLRLKLLYIITQLTCRPGKYKCMLLIVSLFVQPEAIR